MMVLLLSTGLRLLILVHMMNYVKHINAEIIDAHGGLIMPGFINAHHHIYSALARGLSLARSSTD